MICKDVKRYAPLYLSGKLNPPLLAELEHHTSSCTACKSFMDSQVELDVAIRGAVISTTPDASRVRAAVLTTVYATQTREPQKKWRFFRYLPAFAAACICLSAGAIARNVSNYGYFRAALRDHIDDVVRPIAKSGWHTTEAEIRHYLDGGASPYKRPMENIPGSTNSAKSFSLIPVWRRF